MNFDTWWDDFARNYFTHIGYNIEADETAYLVSKYTWQAAMLAERERCAKIAEAVHDEFVSRTNGKPSGESGMSSGARLVAERIREGDA